MKKIFTVSSFLHNVKRPEECHYHLRPIEGDIANVYGYTKIIDNQTRLIIPVCPICGQQHYHGAYDDSTECSTNRVPHCGCLASLIVDTEMFTIGDTYNIVSNYKLQDWSILNFLPIHQLDTALKALRQSGVDPEWLYEFLNADWKSYFDVRTNTVYGDLIYGK